jgi:hypothetical protein
VEAWERVIPGVPVFGALPTDDTIDFAKCKTIFNGKTTRNRMSYILCYGNINPRFVIGIFTDKNTLPYKGEITKSNGVYVEEINNMNAYKYFEELGLAKNGAPDNIFMFVPFLIDQKYRKDYDGIPVLRELGTFTENGTAVFRGDIDVNSTFVMLQGTYDEVLQNTGEKLGEAASLPDINGILTFSCVVRQMLVMQTDPYIELNAAMERVGDIPFMMGYVGGEICPTSVRGSIATNRFHAYSLITLVI